MSVKLEGVGNVQAIFQEIANEIGDKKATSKILIPAMREAMKPVLVKAIGEAPEDTGGLKRSLQIEARRPNRKDKRSKYIANTDKVISLVTTAPGKKLTKLGIKSDARAIAQEFGTARNPKHPYLRDALESQSTSVVSNLAEILRRRIEKYKKANL